jgi:hypothetical protein
MSGERGLRRAPGAPGTVWGLSIPLTNLGCSGGTIVVRIEGLGGSEESDSPFDKRKGLGVIGVLGAVIITLPAESLGRGWCRDMVVITVQYYT